MRTFLIILVLLVSQLGFGQLAIEHVAEQFSKHKYGKIYRCFDDRMKSSVPKDQLKSTWEDLELKAGKFVSLDDIQVKESDGRTTQTGIIKLKEAALKLVVSESEEGKISGLFISIMGYSLPPYAQELKTGKRFIMFKSDSLELNGELIIPVTCNSCPIVIMVHGSGPNDKDETIGPNKVFKDLALGLASKGIASFRYDKRFNVYPELMGGQFDLYDETIDDAIAAYHAIQADTSLHFGKVIMLGHSLGAYAMPLIADSLDVLDGAVLLSSNARRLEDLIEYQMDYLTNFDGTISSEEAKIIEENKLKAQRIREGNYSENTSSDDLLAYWPGTFWKGIEDYNPVTTVKENTETPFLILQGEKDYQITMVDFNIWKDSVGNQANVRMLSFPNLTHLFTPTEAEKPSPNDYFLPNNVNETVIYEIADWIKYLIP